MNIITPQWHPSRVSKLISLCVSIRPVPRNFSGTLSLHSIFVSLSLRDTQFFEIPNPAGNLDTFNDLALSLLPFGQTGNREFRLRFTKQDFYVCRELLPSPCTLLSPVPGLGFPAEWVIDPPTFRAALKDLREAFPEHYQEENEALDFGIIFEDGEFIRALPPSTNTVLRSQRPRPPIGVEELNEHRKEDHNNEDNNILPAMGMRLPKPKDIVLKEVKDFDGSPANLSLFDTQIRNALNKLDIPVYYGGSVSGNEEEGYSYVAANAPEGKPNYRLGEKLCSGISNKFTGPASQWWDDYDTKAGSLKPNCWKKASDALHIPDVLVEVSLYDLLVQQFDPTIDAQQAELELVSYRWNPLDKKALGVVPFRGHVTRLCTRAGKTAWGSKCKSIRNTFPDWLKKQIKMTAKEEVFWEDVAASINTELVDRLDKTCSICLKPGHTADECRKKDGSKEGSKDKDGKDRKKKQCQFCSFEGHEIAECRKMKVAAQQLQQRQPGQQQQQNMQYNPLGFTGV
ncbi:hypothetical protein BGX38DRAFT_1144067 [Terfezia claveryi]|nr:hypothetical protein BGX38DRAFT_1144067 [Terfezia claveryi]